MAAAKNVKNYTIEDDKFIYTVPETGVEIVMPPVRSVFTAGLRRKFRKDNEEFMWQMIERAVKDDQETLDKIDELEMDQFNEFAVQWQESGNFNMGE